VTPCVVYTVHVKTRSTGFLVEPQNQGRRCINGLTSKLLGWFFSGLALKLVVTVSPGLTSKPVATVFFWFGLKTGGDGFSRFGLKTSVGFLV
jgi:hypothetical protein